MTATPAVENPSAARAVPAWRDALAVAAVAALLLLVVGVQLDLSRIHLGLLSFNDQVGYISVARRLLDGLGLSSSIIYTSTLLQDASRNYLYMPGHYFVLAAAYWLLGVGAWQSLLPNLLAYLLVAVATYLLARRFYDRRVGWLAAALFMLFPPNLVYAFSAMSDMTRVAAMVAAFAVFVALPTRWKFLLGPWLVVVPFLFRETCALLIAPMAMLLAQGRGWRRQWPVAVFLIYAVAVLGLVYTQDFSAGRPSLLQVYVFDDRPAVVHRDALAQQAVFGRPLADWLSVLPQHAWANARSFVRAYRSELLAFPTAWVWVEVLVAGWALVGALKWKDLFLWLTAGLMFLHGVFLLTLYDSFGYGWMRMLQTLTPFLAIAAALGLVRAGRWLEARVRRRWAWRAAAVALLSLALVGSIVAVRCFFQPAAALLATADARTAWLEAVGHDDTRMLVSPDVFLDYVYEHHPVEWAFLPANGPTLRLLAERYSIGTLILPAAELDGLFQPDDLAFAGLTFEKTASLDGVDYLIYRGPPAAAAQN